MEGSGGHRGWAILGMNTWELPLQPPREPWRPVDVGDGRAGGHGQTLTPKLEGTGRWMDLGGGIQACLGLGSSCQDLSPSPSPLPLPQVPPAAALAE